MKQVIKILLAILLWGYAPHIFCSFAYNHKADLIVFSYDRPLQLYALLESIEQYVTGVDQIVVILRSSGAQYKSAYSVLYEEFPAVKFVVQDHKNAEKEFKSLLLTAFCNTQSSHVIFAVDDIIVTDRIDISDCIEALEQSQAYAFYLRMGKNITYNYNKNRLLKVPLFSEVGAGIYRWKLVVSRCDAWNYPNTVDFALYRKRTILRDLQKMSYENPNKFESYWYQNASSLKQVYGLCYEHSKIVNIPLNQVQTVFANNKHMENFSTGMLLDLFNQGLKIDIAALFQYKNTSVHMDYEPTFIQRKRKGLS
ncbi:MAG TPA: hypothetical protein VGT41_04015 [Candidatus Babeliales bacterium]|nr:hypothetical protein [Candidatus Babeliales bacterium]